MQQTGATLDAYLAQGQAVLGNLANQRDVMKGLFSFLSIFSSDFLPFYPISPVRTFAPPRSSGFSIVPR
jgi:hypothetical protein